MSGKYKFSRLELKAMTDTIFEFTSKDTDNLLKSYLNFFLFK